LDNRTQSESCLSGHLKRLDPNLPVEDLKTLTQQVRDNTFLDRMMTTLSSLFGGAVTTSLFFMGVATAVAVAPVLIIPAAGLAGARAYQSRIVTRAQLALEQLLDQLERAEYGRRGPAESLLGAIVAAASAIPPRRF